jgi:hypothetical protein
MQKVFIDHSHGRNINYPPQLMIEMDAALRQLQQHRTYLFPENPLHLSNNYIEKNYPTMSKLIKEWHFSQVSLMNPV